MTTRAQKQPTPIKETPPANPYRPPLSDRQREKLAVLLRPMAIELQGMLRARERDEQP